MSNQSTMNEFLLLEFSDARELQILHFLIFLIIYLAALMGNVLIITAIALDHHLHTPMYFFLGNLFFLGVCYISVTVPKSMVNALTNTRLIPFSGCAAQVYLGLSFASEELALLTVMAYDCYIAICHPLNYTVRITRETCAQMAAECWVSSSIYSLLHTVNIFRLPFCGSNAIYQFFCDTQQLLKLSCSDISIYEIVVILYNAFWGLIFFISILVSYIHIFSTVLKIPSSQGRYKAFSTCLPHLLVFWLFISTGIYTYVRPESTSSPYQGMLAAVFYSVVSLVINPLIYSLRNKEIKEALDKILSKIFFSKRCFTS